MAVRYTKSIHAALKRLRACYGERAKYASLRFAQAWGVMTWNDFHWLTRRLTFSKPGVAYLRGYADALDRVRVQTPQPDGSVPTRCLTHAECLAAVRYQPLYPSRRDRIVKKVLRDVLEAK